MVCDCCSIASVTNCDPIIGMIRITTGRPHMGGIYEVCFGGSRLCFGYSQRHDQGNSDLPFSPVGLEHPAIAVRTQPRSSEHCSACSTDRPDR